MDVTSTTRRLLAAVLLLGTFAASAIPEEADSADADDRAVEAAIAKLQSPAKEERRAAVARMSDMSSARATEGLIAALDDPSAAEAAVAALARRAHDRSLRRRAIEGLIHGLDNRKVAVRRTAVAGLADVDTQRSTEGLIHALDASDPAVERAAVGALGRRVGDSRSTERATEGLIHALDSEQAEVRRDAVQALRAVDSERAREGLKKADASAR